MQSFSASKLFHFFDEIYCGIDWQSLCPQNKKVLNLIPTQDKQLSAGVSPSAIVCLSLCGPVINCRHVEGVTPPSPFEGWERLQQPLSAAQTIENGWKDSFFIYRHPTLSLWQFVATFDSFFFISAFLLMTAAGSWGDQRPTHTNKEQHASQPRGQVLWYLDQEVLHACFIAGCNSNRDRGT